ncbi:MAG: hypothetical protein QS721_03950 [Candidatus Endonucleobacter sp. (ex Gigantidas childressi)]|nr:hypothetical protein [Candidatus Endonucleobacter sp. (ex Gigantidas childressi)]
MAATNLFRWERESFEISFLQLRNHSSSEKSQLHYDVTILDEGSLVATLYDLSIPCHPNGNQHDFEKQAIEAVINFILSDDSGQITINWRNNLRRSRLMELSKDLHAWQKTSSEDVVSGASSITT